MTDKEQELLHRYLDGAISEEELQTLETLLGNNKEARATLRTLATIDSKWQQLAAEEDTVVVGSHRGSSRSNSVARLPLIAIGMLAMIAILGIFLGTLMSRSEPKLGVARIIRVEGSIFTDKNRQLESRDELYSGEWLSMDEGLIELAFRETGVHVIATAPLSIRLDSTQQMSLQKGEVKLVVPPQGIGFVVDTPERRITDLGTSFVVKTGTEGSKVLVLDGQIAVERSPGEPKRPQKLMSEGEAAHFDRDGKVRVKKRGFGHPEIIELSIVQPDSTTRSLHGTVFGYDKTPNHAPGNSDLENDLIGRQMIPLIQSGFRDQSCLGELTSFGPLRFPGIAGTYSTFPERVGLTSALPEYGWMVWYHGRAIPPAAGKYRFWGYADNHLLVAINGEAIFEGSRFDSPFKQLGIPRTDNPSLPCLNAMAGFACGPWFEVGDEPVQLDILFGERSKNLTSGLLLVERQEESYEDTYWGQPKWPLFLTEPPDDSQLAELESLRNQMETKLFGSFAVSVDDCWKVAE